MRVRLMGTVKRKWIESMCLTAEEEARMPMDERVTLDGIEVSLDEILPRCPACGWCNLIEVTTIDQVADGRHYICRKAGTRFGVKGTPRNEDANGTTE